MCCPSSTCSWVWWILWYVYGRCSRRRKHKLQLRRAKDRGNSFIIYIYMYTSHHIASHLSKLHHMTQYHKPIAYNKTHYTHPTPPLFLLVNATKQSFLSAVQREDRHKGSGSGLALGFEAVLVLFPFPVVEVEVVVIMLAARFPAEKISTSTPTAPSSSTRLKPARVSCAVFCDVRCLSCEGK